MNIKLRMDGLFDVRIHGHTQKALNLVFLRRIIKEYGIAKIEFDYALKSRRDGDNVLSFGINRTFVVSTYEPEEMEY